ncbi:hypothetical protein BT96DRAFT_945311 [Gymnopus androsaceus JB14]|uniref:Uncharacterized protein n=1 Tax=Gymnopus androsaceus JB14 TaxID=1447944 RepID=A0A6A4GZY8_9AGAR|nr:hypothetical protein BT96DRAFT_945311 [Gymnopus androsaceus JB14]
MSPTYLEITHSEFTKEDGSCRILCATSGESTGIDHPDVRITANVGIVEPRDRNGKGGLHLILYEPWVNDVKLEEFDEEELLSSNDPDRLHMILKQGSKKRECLSRSGIESVLTPCLRQYRASYFNNNSSTCLDYDAYCCNGSAHADIPEPFSLQAHLPGQIWDGSTLQDLKRKVNDSDSECGEDTEEEEKDDEYDEMNPHAHKKCKPKHQKALVERLLRWHHREHLEDPLRDFWPEYLILRDDSILAICKVHPINLTSPLDILPIIHERVGGDFAELWVSKVFTVIKRFDSEFPVKFRNNKPSAKCPRK